MTTLRGFVDGLYAGRIERFYAMPDQADVSFELSTLIKARAGNEPQVDFYEGYWAPDARGTSISHVKSWGIRLLLRSPSSVPTRLKALWLLAWVLVLIAVAFAIAGMSILIADGTRWAAALSFAVTAVSGFATKWITSDLGDAARYLDDQPANVEMRQTIRSHILKVLEYLHDCQRYDRIVVIGHSLGGVIAYDAVRLLWHRRVSRSRFDIDENPVERAAKKLLETGSDQDRIAFRAAQRELCGMLGLEEIPSRDGSFPGDAPRWLVTDLVTVGSPVAYPSLFFTNPKVGLARQIHERNSPTCPSQITDASDFPYSFAAHSGRRYVHHAAVFAAVRWTNIFATADFVGGHIGGLGLGPKDDQVERGDSLKADAGLGLGVHNVEVTSGPVKKLLGVTIPLMKIPVVSHSLYWRARPAQEALLEVLSE
jgi:fermentation-respiration switch protein FrsA (DUF1100 family)